MPTELIEELALIGPEDKIRDELDAWRESIATTLLIGGDAAMVRTAAELVLGLAPMGALDGVLVADFSRILAGPLATMLLGDLGADVVKVERPGTGDDTRTWGPPFRDGESTYYLSVNRNKRSVALDLDRPGRPGAGAHPGAARRRARGELPRRAALERLRPGLRRPARGEPGPRLLLDQRLRPRQGGAAMAGYDFILQAVGGLMSITGDDGEPTKVGVALVDVVAGLYATIGILAALRARERTGRGQRVDVNLLSSVLAATGEPVLGARGRRGDARADGQRAPQHRALRDAALRGRAAGRRGRERSASSRRCARCWAPRLWPRTTASPPTRTGWRTGRAARRSWRRGSRRRGVDDWVDPALGGRRAPARPVNDIAAALELAESLGLAPVRDAGGTPTVADPIGLSETPSAYERPPPLLGEHDGRDPGLAGGSP